MKLRFTIRDLLWLTALIAMGIGWWLDHRSSFHVVDNGRSLRFIDNTTGETWEFMDASRHPDSVKTQ